MLSPLPSYLWNHKSQTNKFGCVGELLTSVTEWHNDMAWNKQPSRRFSHVRLYTKHYIWNTLLIWLISLMNTIPYTRGHQQKGFAPDLRENGAQGAELHLHQVPIEPIGSAGSTHYRIYLSECTTHVCEPRVNLPCGTDLMSAPSLWRVAIMRLD